MQGTRVCEGRELPADLQARRTAASEDGWALMEVVASAAVFVLVVLGALAALDAVTSTAGANKARTVAATLAEEDQERLRGKRSVSVAGLDETRTLEVSGLRYTIRSRAEWVRDATGETVSCTSTEGQISYLRITSTVTSPATGAAVRPVTISSIVAPPPGSAGTKGTLAVQVRNAAGLPVMNLPVSASGPASRTVGTNEAGCAVFSLLPAGAYAVSLSQGAWVDKAGRTQVAREGVGVNPGEVSTVNFDYDKAASAGVQVQTVPLGTSAPVADPATSVLAANTGVPPSGFLALHGSASAYSFPNLFPFPDGYTVFAGSCLGADPSRHVDGYYDSHPGRLAVSPGMPAGTVAVREPALNLRVTRGGNSANAPANTNPSGMAVRIWSRTEGCSEVFEGTLSRGKLVNPGLPFGVYDVCVTDGHHTAWEHGVANTLPEGSPEFTVWVDTRGNNGACPEAGEYP